MLVKDMFYSIQGEGPYLGEPTMFIRFAGCNLDCEFCDEGGPGKKNYTNCIPEELVLDISEYIYDKELFVKRIVLTGGEPLMQNYSELIKLIHLLKNQDFEVGMESNGVLLFNNPAVDNIELLENLDYLMISPKEYDSFIIGNQGIFEKYWNKIIFKLLVHKTTDTINHRVLKDLRRINYKDPIYLLPCHFKDNSILNVSRFFHIDWKVGEEEVKSCMDMIKNNKSLDLRLTLQAHKFWGLQ